MAVARVIGGYWPGPPHEVRRRTGRGGRMIDDLDTDTGRAQAEFDEDQPGPGV
ncbi:hypothetical protein ACI79D_07755 [Geodermatophilus sp. SYSU D00708]